jgi:hypothetical protein
LIVTRRAEDMTGRIYPGISGIQRFRRWRTRYGTGSPGGNWWLFVAF